MNPVIDDKYRIISELGRGGMGVVYEAVHLGLGHRVAVKFLTEAGVADEALLARFAREARAGANIASEHVARVFDLGITSENIPYLVMELLEGDDLANVLEHHPVFRVADAVRFTLQAVAAMAESHAIGIVHRDLKPENVFLLARRGASPIVKILDFGLAKIRTHVDAAKTEAEIVFGTPKYMAPEQLRSTADTGPEADVWALGVILYQMLTGRRPFDGPIISVVIAEILTKDPVAPREIRPEIPSALEAVVLRCLDRDLERRPTAAELGELLLPFTDGCDELVARTKATSAARPDLSRIAKTARMTTLRRSRIRTAQWAVLGTVCVALFVAGLALSLLRAQKARGDGSARNQTAVTTAMTSGRMR
jgi:eukaryotic-like serine/threonine-protein kinase